MYWLLPLLWFLLYTSSTQNLWARTNARPAHEAACSGAKFINGILHATCTDSVTGYEFEYIDFDRSIHDIASAAAKDELNDRIYAHYESGQVSPHAQKPENESLSNPPMWYQRQMSSAHAFMSQWHEFAQQFLQGVGERRPFFRKTGSNVKTNHICTLRHPSTNSCISWAAYNMYYMTETQIKDMSNRCWKDCEAVGMECEAFVNPGDIGIYYCS